MATTKIWAVRGWIGQVVNYVENEEKTYSFDCSKKNKKSGCSEIVRCEVLE